MSNMKTRLVIYLTDKDRARVKERASLVGRSMGDYVAELVMWDKQFELVERAREGTLEAVASGKLVAEEQSWVKS